MSFIPIKKLLNFEKNLGFKDVESYNLLTKFIDFISSNRLVVDIQRYIATYPKPSYIKNLQFPFNPSSTSPNFAIEEHKVAIDKSITEKSRRIKKK